MNMKKTIAAIAAGAVAVSAMATTVSAVEAKTLNYNLTATLEAQNNGKVTLKATFPNVPLTVGQDVVIRVASNSNGGWDDKIVVSGQYIDVNKTINPIAFTENTWTEGYSKVTADMMESDAAQDPNANQYWHAWFAVTGTTGCPNVLPAGLYGHEITIPVYEVNTGAPALIGATGEKVEAIYDQGGVKTIIPVDLANFKLNQPTATLGTTTITYDGTATAWDTAPAAYGVSIPASITPADGDTIAITYSKQVTQTANITVTATLNNINTLNNGDIGDQIAAGKFFMDISTDGGVTFKRGDAAYSGLTAATKFKMPFRTTLNDNYDIVEYLEHANVIGDDKHYVNVRAVLNDAIENYDGVTFTFNTAAGKVKYALASGRMTQNPAISSTLYTTYEDALKAAGAGQYVTAVYNDDYNAVDTYTAFGEHTYDWYYAPETTGFTGYDWGGQNLFAGALVINEGLTMSLSNTEYFDWTKTSVSFDWEAIMDNAATTNNYATYIHSLKLATSNMWFWDSMDVVLTTGEADDVSADAGVTADDATLDDDDDDITADDDDVEPADDDDDDEPAPVVDEPAPAPVATNPPTGNASVALAVIPVALAAAAIVAKKRG